MAKAGNIYVIMGNDEGSVAEEAHKLFNQLKPADSDDFANDIIEGTAGNSEDAYSACGQTIEALQTLPFFGGDKIVWLKRASFLAGGDRTSDSDRTKQGVEALKEAIEQGVPDSVKLIISCTGIDKRRAFYKLLDKIATIRSYDKPDVSKDGWQDIVANMVRQKANDYGMSFEAEAMELFVMRAGEDTRQINSELAKLDLYLGDQRRQVEVDDVQLMVPLSRAGIVFEIGRALQKKNAVRAIEIVNQQLARNEAAIGLLRASIIPTVRNLFMAKAATAGRKVSLANYNQFAAAINALPENERSWLPQKKAGGVNAYPLFLAARDANKFSLPALRKAMDSCLEADLSLVSTGQDHRMILHRLIAIICTEK
ncbi:DNA polymerase III subunit delta [Persicirhabdus sediminis]|uniref:DNA polymerase III subunit delta n=1 Tax=Persicirhabdus sediminis TaxID=454144 RepID=A0A8J7MHL6_9BACT|nr:DNA polymerase III subunit delta [Persicirhabdus sediminis]MBK1792094.1 DNA polymerase III subunit delta [Persicirhabdus sediminis]